MASSYVNPWSTVRCLFESPILDDRKWAKLPTIPADAFILDLEDAVPVSGKLEARTRVVATVEDPSYFDGRMTVPRPNPLDTEWGHADLVEVSRAGAETVMLAKVGSVADIDSAREVCAGVGADPSFLVSIESARGVLNAREILAHPSVVAATFGPGDLHVDAGMALYEPDGQENPGLLYPRVATVLAGVATDVPILGIAFAPNIKNLDDIASRVSREQRLGFSGCCAFYPPHVDIINDVFTPSEGEVANATEIIEAYDAATAAGSPAVQLESGEAVLLHQYKEALRTVARSR